MGPGDACELGITARRREAAPGSRTRNVADVCVPAATVETVPSTTFFSVSAPVGLSRCTSTNLPLNERAAVTTTLKLVGDIWLSVICGRTFTVTTWLVAAFHFAW